MQSSTVNRFYVETSAFPLPMKSTSADQRLGIGLPVSALLA